MKTFTGPDYRCEAEWVGLKLQANQAFLFPGMEKILRAFDVHVIVLRRENLLEVFVSHQIAKMRNVFHSETPGVIEQPLKVDPAEALKYLDTVASVQNRAILLFQGCPMHELTYDGLFDPSQPDKEFLGILDFLGLGRTAPQKPALSKQVTLPLDELIENYGEVVAALLENGYNERGKPLGNEHQAISQHER